MSEIFFDVTMTHTHAPYKFVEIISDNPVTPMKVSDDQGYFADPAGNQAEKRNVNFDDSSGVVR